MAEQPERDLWDIKERHKLWGEAITNIEKKRQQSAELSERRQAVAQAWEQLKQAPDDETLQRELETLEEDWLEQLRDADEPFVKELGEARRRRLSLEAEKSNPSALEDRILGSDSEKEREIALKSLFEKGYPRGLDPNLSAPEYAKAQQRVATLKDGIIKSASKSQRKRALDELSKLMGGTKGKAAGQIGRALLARLVANPYTLGAMLLWALGIGLIFIIMIALIQGPFQKLFGTGPEEVLAVGNQEDMDALRLADCLNEERADLEETNGTLPEDCIKLLEGEPGKPGHLATLEESLEESRTRAEQELEDGEKKAEALAALEKMEQELAAMNPRGPYKELKAHVVAFELARKQYAAAFPGIVLDVPHTIQEPDECGMASVGMVVNYYRAKQGLSEEPYRNICPSTALVHHLNSQLATIGGPIYSDLMIDPSSSDYFANIKDSIDRGHPVIWLNGFYSGGHFMVLNGYRTDGSGAISTFIATDPAGAGLKNVDTIEGTKLTPENIRARGSHAEEGSGYFYVR